MLRIATGLLLAGLTSTAMAGPIIPGVTSLGLSGTDGNHNWSMNPGNVPFDELGRFSWGKNLPEQATPSFTVSNILVSGNIDPVLSVSFNVTNNTLSTQTYIFQFSLPISPAVTPASLTGGSTGFSISDNNGNGVTAGDALPADAFYTAIIDGVDYQTMDLLSTNLSAGNFESAIRNDSFGVPIPSQLGPAANTDIGLRYKFTLTPGDSAAVTGVFVVEPVPEPGSLALIATGGALLVRRRRSR